MKKYVVLLFSLIAVLALFLQACVNDPETYTVSFMVDGEEIYSCQVEENGTAVCPPNITVVKPSTPQYEYVFTGWDCELEQITSNLTVNAVFEEVKRAYVVTFLNGEDVLKTQTVEYGGEATAPTDIPTKEQTPQYSYTFTNWDVEFDNITKNLTVSAVFAQTVRSYTVTFLNGSDVLKTQTVEYGSEATAPDIPTLAPTPQYNYTFIRWDVAFDNITADLTVKAVFEQTIRSYNVTIFRNETQFETQTIEYGEFATKPNVLTGNDGLFGFYKDAEHTQVFDFESEEVTQDCSIYAKVHVGKTITYKKHSAQDMFYYAYYLEPGAQDVIEVNLLTEYEGLPVTELGANLFAASNIQTVTIPDSYTVIGTAAFDSCHSLKRVYIPKNIVSIAVGAFGKSKNIEEIEVAAENPVFASKGNCLIEVATKTLFLGCKTSIIPDDGTVTTIANYAFQGAGITSLTIPSGVTKIGDGVFRSCENLTSITIANTVTEIGFRAFSHCKSLTQLVIPLSVITTDADLFQAGNAELKVFCEAEEKPSGWRNWWSYAPSTAVAYFANDWHYVNGVPTPNAA